MSELIQPEVFIILLPIALYKVGLCSCVYYPVGPPSKIFARMEKGERFLRFLMEQRATMKGKTMAM